MQEIVLGGGCFWCIEAAFEIVDGIIDAQSGYANCNIENPTYKEVCTDTTGCVEVVKLSFDETKITLEEILELFFKIHDPTTLNHQGADYGSQYRSVILTNNKEQEKIVKEFIEKIQPLFDKKIVTKVEPLRNYYKAEEYHQDYFRKNPYQPYCKAVALPKIIKAKEWLEKRKK